MIQNQLQEEFQRKFYRPLLNLRLLQLISKPTNCRADVANFQTFKKLFWIISQKWNKWISHTWNIKNKRPIGHITHLRKQFKSIIIYDYIITLIKRRKKNITNFMRNYWFFIWRNLNHLHPRMHCAKFGWNWLIGSGEDF